MNPRCPGFQAGARQATRSRLPSPGRAVGKSGATVAIGAGPEKALPLLLHVGAPPPICRKNKVIQRITLNFLRK